ncbi:tetratricopeptide repeat protein [Planktothrix sp. FACHB-1355]|uniref:protein-glutamate O-methyltransferase n=1 Tax=Aerosakkonema funiforme FACHB-1375 TaxID=2949571 RepID=A0A926VG26_9CYAN|nr:MULTISPECIES: CheR family methyltransferase [Oscillatoriales]MBD2183030.1 tetratricopeptide repeat protein [Aerosakkonema funiforme FACHB-1375]MBD3560140.1 tetratricopeptide repeat protein [Planktothrix sp. FACHB-1355]
MNEALIQRFVELISSNTGLHVREQDRENLAKIIWARLKILRLSTPEDYYQLLQPHTDSNAVEDTLPEREWRELTHLLTTGESYFFRDKGQFALLRNMILPELIAAKNNAANIQAGEKRSLRIWSAGCSTGEEPYSLAILLQELLTDLDDWNIFILGTDLNQQAIEKAKAGIYSPWSFRLVDTDLQMRYFHQRKTEWQVDKRIGTMVKFAYGNLVKDHYPSLNSDIHSMDLILCRNVFVYFEYNAISVVLKKFYDTLLPSGYLITGHTELYAQDLGCFQVKVLPESVLYQRKENVDFQSTKSVVYKATIPEVNRQESPKGMLWERPNTIGKSWRLARPNIHTEKSYNSDNTTTLAKSREMIVPDIPNSILRLTSSQMQSSPHKIEEQDLLLKAEKLFDKKAYAEAIRQAEQIILLQPANFGAYYLLAQAYANLGEHNKAIYYCDRATELDPLSVIPYYLLAHIAEEKGDIEKAKIYLKRIIYLVPSSISAYLELGLIYKREGNAIRARKMLATAIELLKDLPPSATVAQQDEVTAGELLAYVHKVLRDRT